MASTRSVTVGSTGMWLTHRAAIGPHTIGLDEPFEEGGKDRGPAPFELIAAALGASTAMTIRRHATLQNVPLQSVHVTVDHELDPTLKLHLKIQLRGGLDEKQCQQLMKIAATCPVRRALGASIKVDDALIP